MSKKTPAFEEQLTQLEEIVRRMDSEQLPLDKLLTLYEQGVQLGASLNQMLNEAQQRIEILTQDQNGTTKKQPFEESES